MRLITQIQTIMFKRTSDIFTQRCILIIYLPNFALVSHNYIQKVIGLLKQKEEVCDCHCFNVCIITSAVITIITNSVLL